MPKQSIICALLIALGGLLLSAAGASAAFVAPGESYPTKFELTGENVKFAGESNSVTCKKATFTGELTEAATKATVTPSYKECSVSILGVEIKASATVKECKDVMFEGGVVEGPQETRESTGELEIASKTCEIIFEAEKCKITVDGQGPLGGLTYLDTEKEGKEAGLEVKAAVKELAYKTNSNCAGEKEETHKKGEYKGTVKGQNIQQNPPLFTIPGTGLGSRIGFATQGGGVQTFLIKAAGPKLSLDCNSPELYSVASNVRTFAKLKLSPEFEATACSLKREAGSFAIEEVKNTGGCYLELTNVRGRGAEHEGSLAIVPAGCKLEFKLTATPTCVVSLETTAPQTGVSFNNTKITNPVEMLTLIKVAGLNYSATAACETTYSVPISGTVKYEAGLINGYIYIVP